MECEQANDEEGERVMHIVLNTSTNLWKKYWFVDSAETLSDGRIVKRACPYYMKCPYWKIHEDYGNFGTVDQHILHSWFLQIFGFINPF